MKYSYCFCCGTAKGGEKAYFFSFQSNLAKIISFNEIEDLTAEEIGQILGGN